MRSTVTSDILMIILRSIDYKSDWLYPQTEDRQFVEAVLTEEAQLIQCTELLS